MRAVVVTPTAPGRKIVGVVIAPLFVDVVRLGVVDGFAAVSTMRHTNTYSMHRRQNVTVWPG